MRRNKTALAAAITAAFMAPLTCAEVDTSDWNCEYCPFEKGYSAEYEAGVTSVSGEDGYRFGSGTGFDDESAYADVGGEGKLYGESTQTTWKL
mgnify:FL=1